MLMISFFNSFWDYVIDIVPALIIGFLLSGIVHEFISEEWVEKNLKNKNIKGVLYSTLIGALVPVCCWGCLPIAISFRKKGASLGPILAILVATPATSINAIIVTAQFFGWGFAAYLFFSVCVMGIVIGIIGNHIDVEPDTKNDNCNHGCDCKDNHLGVEKNIPKKFKERVISILKFAYIEMPKDVGKETAIGLALAAFVDTVLPVGAFVKQYLVGPFGYIFALVFGILTYMCATMGVPLVHAFVNQGMDIGPGFVLLLVGPITSYGTILVLRKEFGTKILIIYLSLISVLSVILGYIYSMI